MQEFYSDLMGKDEAEVMDKIENASSRPKVGLMQAFFHRLWVRLELWESFIIQ